MNTPVHSFTSAQLRKIADLIDAMDAMDPTDDQNPSGVYPKPLRLGNNDNEDFGTISDPDGTGYFWSPAGVPRG